MAYNEDLAEEIRSVIENHDGVTEKKMFGGVAFMMNGNMFVGIVGNDLMVRVGKENHSKLVKEPHARVMDFTGKPMMGYLFIEPEGWESRASLEGWIGRAMKFVKTLPKKSSKK